MNDPRLFCDHGLWKGPCSKEKHQAIKMLNSHKEGYEHKFNRQASKIEVGELINPMLSFSVMFANYIDNIRFTDAGHLCKCCKVLLNSNL